MHKWKCRLCPFEVQNENRDKVPALRDYHMRTKHGSDQVVAPSGAKPKKKDRGVLDAVGDFFEGVAEGVFKLFD